jgi:hypothetical protein
MTGPEAGPDWITAPLDFQPAPGATLGSLPIAINLCYEDQINQSPPLPY